MRPVPEWFRDCDEGRLRLAFTVMYIRALRLGLLFVVLASGGWVNSHAQTDLERSLLLEALRDPNTRSRVDVTLTDDHHRRAPLLRPLMAWKIEKGMYAGCLLGSVHLGDESLYPLPAAVMDAFAKARVAVFEVHPGELNADFQQKLHQRGQLPEGQTLRERVGPATWAKLEDARRRNDMPIDMNGWQPWYAALALTFAEIMRGTGHQYTPNLGIDRHVMEEARRHGKDVRGLESAEEQLMIVTTLRDEVSAALLDQTLEQLDDLKRQTARLLAVWRHGDVKALWELVDENFADYPELYREWLVARNERWAAALDRMFEEGVEPFVVVGAAHLVGPDGLPELLRARGFTVNQVIQALEQHD